MKLCFFFTRTEVVEALEEQCGDRILGPNVYRIYTSMDRLDFELSYATISPESEYLRQYPDARYIGGLSVFRNDKEENSELVLTFGLIFTEEIVYDIKTGDVFLGENLLLTE